MLVGYARVSTTDQNLERQIDQLVSAGVDRRNIYKEKISGTKRNRPELDKLLAELQEGDTVIITELSRISRSTKDTLDIVEQIKNKRAYIKSLAETWLDTTSGNPSSQLLLTIMAGFCQFERDLTAERVRDGLAAARRRGRVGGRPSKQKVYKDIIEALYDGGVPISDIARQTSLSRSTVNRVLKKQK